MTDVLASGPNGEGVKVAVVDTGIEVCHPDLRLRGYNGLNAERQFSGLLNSLGVSTYFPNSTDAHVFNMSFGSAAPEPNNIDVYFERVFTHGVRNLRSGLGAIYVKAAGNSFRDCASLERDINESLGCVSSNGDDWSNLPYLSVVGAFNADDLGTIAFAASPDPRRLADRAFEALVQNAHGQYDDLIRVLTPALGRDGLERLKQLMVQ